MSRSASTVRVCCPSLGPESPRTLLDAEKRIAEFLTIPAYDALEAG
ncbi:MAG: hypothetical protein ACR2FL_08170 [Nocardioidaceae bacterium]